jgi:hypothetical protein
MYRFCGEGRIMKHEFLKALIDCYGENYSESLGIDLRSGEETEIFKWFLASILFGAPIRESSAIKTYRCFKKHGVLKPDRILSAGWERLVRILDEGGYTRYDFKTADKLLEVMQNLKDQYDGSLKLLHERASDSFDLEERLKNLGKGIGDTTVNIFLRELRSILTKARPGPSSMVVLAAKNLGITKKVVGQVTLEELENFWQRNEVKGKSFINFETALLRLGKDFYSKGRPIPVQAKREPPHRTEP